MTISRHIYEIYIKATPDQIWNALVDPAFTVQYFHGTAIEGGFAEGEGYRYLMDSGDPAIEGVVTEVEPGRRVAMTFRFMYEPTLAEEPPSRVEWILTPAGDVTRVTLRHGDLFKSPLTWARARMGWLPILNGLKTLLETGTGLGNVDDPEAAVVSEDPEGDWHRAQGVAANNGTWDWLGKSGADRTEDDEEQMTMSAYAAAYHWARATGAGPANTARANWLLSRVWAVRGNGELALHHADLVMATCTANDLADFDLAYAYEARARALACLGRGDEARAERERAGAVPIAEDDDRALVEDDLASEPWFGV